MVAFRPIAIVARPSSTFNRGVKRASLEGAFQAVLAWVNRTSLTVRQTPTGGGKVS